MLSGVVDFSEVEAGRTPETPADSDGSTGGGNGEAAETEEVLATASSAEPEPSEEDGGSLPVVQIEDRLRKFDRLAPPGRAAPSGSSETGVNPEPEPVKESEQAPEQEAAAEESAAPENIEVPEDHGGSEEQGESEQDAEIEPIDTSDLEEVPDAAETSEQAEESEPGREPEQAEEKAPVPELEIEIEGEVFDSETAMSHFNDDLELLVDVACLFLDEFPKKISEAREAVAGKNGKRLMTAAETIKSTAGAIGAKRVLAAAQHLRIMGHTGDLTHAARVCDVMEQEVESFGAALEAFTEEEPQQA
jgi:hypothetical protein